MNVAFMLALLLVLLRLARSGVAASDGRSLVVFGHRGFIGLCAYLLTLYGITYFFLRPEGRPSAAVQLITLAFYGVPMAGLWYYRRREPRSGAATAVVPQELRRAVTLLAAVLGLSFLLSFPSVKSAVYVAVVANFVLWTPLGCLLTAIALWRGWRE
ncbi:MAG: hypothetical protein AAB676_18155 [Verrucomicrobiota bacterium]